jgi:hypothetical protein
MKIKKNTFSTLVLELFSPSIANCKKLKIQKSTSPTPHPFPPVLCRGWGSSGSFQPEAVSLVMAFRLWGSGLNESTKNDKTTKKILTARDSRYLKGSILMYISQKYTYHGAKLDPQYVFLVKKRFFKIKFLILHNVMTTFKNCAKFSHLCW